MLAFITANERKLLLSEYGAPTSEDWAEAATNGLENELEKIKNNGYCENASGQNVRSLAVPIIENDILLGSLGMYLPAFRFDESNKNGVLENMKATVENILSRIQSL
jgi:DNA-binding IclR family transcriptional regulator